MNQLARFTWTLWLGSAIPFAPLWARGEPGWQFDLPSALVGFVLGLLCAWAVYRLRHRFAAARDTVQSRAEHVQERLSTGVEDRYREHVIEQAEKSHLLQRYASLSELYVHRRLIVPHTVPAASGSHESAQEAERWRSARLYDVFHPSPTTIDLTQAIRQHHKLAFLGPMGSGRTTLLAYLAQLYGRRAGWRLTLPEPQEEDPPELVSTRERERERLPVQIALQLVDVSLADQGGRHALIEPIADYLGASLHGLIAVPSTPMVRNKIIKGDCILLFDNLDMLDAGTRRQVLHWIDQLSRAYPDNVCALTGDLGGYAALWEIGFAVLKLDGFDQQVASRFAERWSRMREDLETQRWEIERAAGQAAFEQEVARTRRAGLPPPPKEDFLPTSAPALRTRLLDAWPSGHRGQIAPLELALAALLWREHDTVPQEPLMRTARAAFAAFNRAADGLLSPPQWARVLASVAWEMQLAHRYQDERQTFEQTVTDLLDTTYAASADLRHMTEEEEEEKPNFARQGRSAFSALLRTGDLVRQVGRGRVAFVHPTFRAYFAAQHAARTDESTTLIDHVRDPQWQDTILSYSALTNVAPLVMARLKATDDLFRTNFFAAAGYLAASPEADERLRGSVLAELAQVFLNPMQPTALGRRAAETIARSKDKGSIYLFGQAMSHQDAHIRLLGVWGLSLVEDRRALSGLKRALADPDRLVRIEALHALAASAGNEPAVDGLVQGLQDEDELTRRVAAELLSTAGQEGHDLLRQAVESEDMYIRRAGVFGLGAVREPWATDVVDHMRREDDEWFVRSAATEVMERLSAPPPPIAPELLKQKAPEWLSSWAAENRVTMDSTEAALRAAVQAMQQDEWTVKLAAGDLMRVLGGPEAIPALKDALKDENMLIRETAFAVLHEISTRIGSHIPA